MTPHLHLSRATPKTLGRRKMSAGCPSTNRYTHVHLHDGSDSSGYTQIIRGFPALKIQPKNKGKRTVVPFDLLIRIGPTSYVSDRDRKKPSFALSKPILKFDRFSPVYS